MMADPEASKAPSSKIAKSKGSVSIGKKVDSIKIRANLGGVMSNQRRLGTLGLKSARVERFTHDASRSKATIRTSIDR